jgi:predicted anti-sigma-YlaC factor YlaD
MECEKFRIALSARLDGEEPGLPADTIAGHLAACVGCRGWLSRAERVTRAVRVQAVDVPDLTARILTAACEAGALPEPSRRRWAVTVGHLRWALGLLAALQLLLAVPDLLGTVGHAAHASREVAAFDVALSVGLLIAAWYPEQARVFAPVVATLVLCFATISAVDVLQGVVTAAQIALHMVAVAQAGLLWLLARSVAPRQPPPLEQGPVPASKIAR